MEDKNVKALGSSRSFKIIFCLCGVLFSLHWGRRLGALFGGGAGLIPFLLLAAAVLWLVWRFRPAEGERERALSLLAALFCTVGFTLFTETDKSLLWLFVYAAWAFLARFALKRKNGRAVRHMALCLGLLFALAVFLGRQLDAFGRLELLYGTADGALRYIAAFGGLWLGFSLLLNTAFALLLEKAPGSACKWTGAGSFAVFTGLILLCWLPYLYAYYPGSLSPDSLKEISQQLGLEPLSNHHPFLHQLLIGLCLRLGGELETGVALYSVVQMLLLAGSFALCLVFLGRMGVSRGGVLVSFAFFALYPVNGYYSVTMWKDVLHGGASLVLMLLLCAESAKAGEKGKAAWLRAAGIAAALLVFCALRNNGWYAFLLGFPLYILLNRAGWKRLTAVFAAVLLMMSGYNHILYEVLGIEKSSSAEALSVPLQQIARTASLNPQELDSPEMQVLSEIFHDFDTLGERYLSFISDPVKAPDSFNAAAFGKDPARYLAAWAKLGIAHPVTYVEAFLLQCYGYWYPDTQYWIIHSNIEPNALGLEQRPDRLGLRFELDSLIRELSEEQPTAVLFSIGLMVWLIILAAALLILRRRAALASPLVIMAMLWLTTLASPVYCEYRYLYGLAVSVPLFLALALGLGTKE